MVSPVRVKVLIVPRPCTVQPMHLESCFGTGANCGMRVFVPGREQSDVVDYSGRPIKGVPVIRRVLIGL